MASAPLSRSASPHGLIPRLISDPAYSDVLDKRHLQHFCQNTVPSTNSVLHSQFWSRIVLQTCHVEPAVKHCVLALSSHHLGVALARIDAEAARQHETYSLVHYRKALETGRELIASASVHNIDRVLTACIMFIIYEGARGNFTAAAMHMDSGRAIVAQNVRLFRASSRRKDLSELERTLARLDLPAICFQDASAPYRYTLADFYQTNPVLDPNIFEDVEGAHSCFVDLARWLLLVGERLELEMRNGDTKSMTRYELEKEKCANTIDLWHARFETLSCVSDSNVAMTVLNLRLWYWTARLYIAAEEYGPEDRWDAFPEYFQQMIIYGEQLARALTESHLAQTCTFDMGYIIPLFVVATKCREPEIRRKAIAILRDYPRQEGPWKSVGCAAIATRWMEIDEEGLDQVFSAKDVPEWNRVVKIDTQLDVGKDAASMKVTTGAGVKPSDVLATWQKV